MPEVLRPDPASEERAVTEAGAGGAPAPRSAFLREDLLLACCGAVLMVTQYIVVRELGSVLFSTELVTLASVVMVLTGPSIAYAVADHVGNRLLSLWGALTFGTLLGLPVGVRGLTACMLVWEVQLPVLILVFLGGGLLTSAFFAVFLPRLVRSGGGFRRLYAVELAGALAGLLLIGLAPSWHVLLGLFSSLIVLVLHLALQRKLLTLGAVLAGFLAAVCYPGLDRWAAELYYRANPNLRNSKVLATEYSPYQRIDVVQDRTQRLLFLDGILYYDADAFHWFNYYIAELPGRFVRNKGNALVVGSGSLGSTGYLVRQGFAVTTVELDRKVAEVGMKYFQEVNRLASGDFDLQIGDARRWVAEHPGNRYDLIVLDIPAPFHAQTALLYSPAFLGQLKACLRPGGMVTVNAAWDDLFHPVAVSIIRGACLTFEEVMAVKGESLGLTILYCAPRLPMTIDEVQAELATEEKQGFKVFTDYSLRFASRGVRPHSEENLTALLHIAWARFPGMGR